MTTEEIAYLALLVSVLSLLLNFVVLYRDRHTVRARAAIIQNGSNWDLSVTVSNAGKRPISIEHVKISIANGNHAFFDFGPNGSVPIDVGGSSSIRINGTKVKIWNDLEELRAKKVYVVDALGSIYPAKIDGT